MRRRRVWDRGALIPRHRLKRWSVKWKNPEIALFPNGLQRPEVDMLERTAKADSSDGLGGKGMAVSREDGGWHLLREVWILVLKAASGENPASCV